MPAGYRLCPQEGAGLAARMCHLFRVHSQEGYERIVLRGTDSPTLPLERVQRAFEVLEWADGVLCPDRDGGYSLIGLRKPWDALFDLEMSRADVLERTLARAASLGLRVELLPPHHDVDSAQDLALLGSELREQQAPRTARWIKQDCSERHS